MDSFKSISKEIILTYVDAFKAFPFWKQAAITSLTCTGSFILGSACSYYISKSLHPSTPIIHYTIHGNINSSTNNNILILIHGFPDLQDLWDLQVKYFKPKGYCCITLELPNFNNKRIQNPWGYSLETVVDALATTISNIIQTHTNTTGNTPTPVSPNITLIAHDWGAFLTQMMYIKYFGNDNKNGSNILSNININKLILVDVGDYNGGMAYQSMGASFFAMPTLIGTIVLRALTAGVPFPAYELEKRDNTRYVDSRQAYLYYYTFINSMFGGINYNITNGLLSAFEKNKLPILFVNGTQGPKFCTDKFEKYIKETNDCKYVDLHCTHWVMSDKIGKPDQLNKEIEQFIA